MAQKALLSVYHKGGIVDFAKELIALGFELIASGGTAKTLQEADLPVQDVAELVGGGPILGHRVVTLSREVHAGLLATTINVDLEEMEKLGLPYIDLVCVDLYPLKDEIVRIGSTRETVIDKTDIGGPTMLRSAAKGRRIVICNPDRRQQAIDWLKAGKPNEDRYITELAAEAEGVVADYCLASARYHSGGDIDGFVGKKVTSLKYGENPSHKSTLFSIENNDPLALHLFDQIAGAVPSHINITDADRLLRTVLQIAVTFQVNTNLTPCIAVVVKHGNACGVGIGDSDDEEAIKKMILGDPMAMFGGVIMTNFWIDGNLANLLRTYKMPEGKKRVISGVIAPSFSSEADKILERKGGKCFSLAYSPLGKLSVENLESVQYRPVRGGFLRQNGEPFILNLNDSRLERSIKMSSIQERDLLLAFAIGSTSNSNTITLVKDGMLIGNGVGQTARVRAAKLALMIAEESGHNPIGAVAYSDSFFPEPDGLEVLAKAGVTLIFASSGSIKDANVRQAATDCNVAFYTMPDSICRGFCWH